jgi:hypothetical protein
LKNDRIIITSITKPVSNPGEAFTFSGSDEFSIIITSFAFVDVTLVIWGSDSNVDFVSDDAISLFEKFSFDALPPLPPPKLLLALLSSERVSFEAAKTIDDKLIIAGTELPTIADVCIVSAFA